jgi:phytoene desaturase
MQHREVAHAYSNGQFGKTSHDYFSLVQLDPAFQFYFSGERLQIPCGKNALVSFFDQLEPGSGERLIRFLANAKVKYDLGMGKLAYAPTSAIAPYVDASLIRNLFAIHPFESLAGAVRKHFSDPRIIQLLEFPSLFLGAPPSAVPSLYTLMNYAGLELGTWYPTGGMHQLIQGMVTLATSLGVKFEFNNAVESITPREKSKLQIQTVRDRLEVDGVVASADYHHVDQELLPEGSRNYNANYWQKRKLAPSCLIFFVGVGKKINNLLHHNLFFDSDFNRHIEEIYTVPSWPKDPLFYVCAPSKTDNTVAPAGCENLFVLIPVAPGLNDDPRLRDEYLHRVVERIEAKTGDSFQNKILFHESYSPDNFSTDYNAYLGNGYGLANTLRQTAFGKPSTSNRRLKNLFYAGQMTAPGPGIPACIISGQIAADELQKKLSPQRNLIPGPSPAGEG